MLLLLIVLLAVTLVIIVAGFVLSARPFERSERPVYQGERRRSRPLPQERPVRPVRAQEHAPVARSRAQYQPRPQYQQRTQAQRRVPATALSVSVQPERVSGRRAGQPLPWKTLTIGLISVFILGLYSLNLLLPHHAFLGYNPFADTIYNNSSANSQSSPAQPVYNASKLLIRVSQLDPAQYNTPQEYNTWAYSACSAASMTEVVNAYNHHYRVIDILAVESRIGEITPELGLLEEPGISRTMSQFGFKTTWGHNLTLNQIIDVANHGRPVIVSFPPDRYAGGHLLVVRGGDSQYVYTADSSRLNHTYFSRARFLQLWGGFYAISTPR